MPRPPKRWRACLKPTRTDRLPAVARRSRRARRRRSSSASSIATLPAPEIRAGRLRRFLPQPDPGRERAPARRRRIRACPSGVRSRRACSSPTWWCSARSTTARGPRPPIPALAQPADARRARAALARGTHRRTPRTTSRRSWRAERSILTRAQKIDGVPTVPSRWLHAAAGAADGLRSGRRAATRTSRGSAGRARAMAVERTAVRIEAPEPRPAVDARPRKMSVTEIETLDRQSLCASSRSHVLKLDNAAGARRRARRGAARLDRARRHAAICGEAIPSALPADTQAELLAIAREVLASYDRHPRVAAFWPPRFERFAAWFAETEPARRAGRAARRRRESADSWSLPAPAGPFTLTARADRIDDGRGLAHHHRLQDGRRRRPTAGVERGHAPQLPLEAAIAHGEAASRMWPAARSRRCATSAPPAASRRARNASSSVDDVAGLAATRA